MFSIIPIQIIVLFAVFILVSIRQIGNLRLQIWQLMLFGSLVVLITGQISPNDALTSINFDVILFLFGVFVISKALEESGILQYFSSKIFHKAKSTDMLILLVLFVAGGASAILMNDTLAIIGTPIMLMLASQYKISPKLLLLALAFAITIGSVASPIGNPQNLLIALNMHEPFIPFIKFLLIPTIINLFVAYLLLKIFYKNEFMKLSRNLQEISESKTKPDFKLSLITKISFVLFVSLLFLKILLTVLNINILNFDLRLSYIAIISAVPLILFSSRRSEIIRNIDWHTLIFFVAMFVLMQSVWDTNFFQNLIEEGNLDISSIPVLLTISVVLSQFIQMFHLLLYIFRF
ncbi:MAG: hypothetical protein BWK75_01765 [Candidatus Altiarchaeales archaeon A3]|nr:MAG: hypothetical protein BWK75_01765 [Candidatus Altiarchaeales archaeon A3]